MAKPTETGNCAPWGWAILLVGILFLLQDLRLWDFWGLNWWTVAFLLFGALKIWGHR